MVVLTPEAQGHIDGLLVRYESLGRAPATRHLLQAIEDARARITVDAAAGLPAPRPYPDLKKPGRLWLKEGRYWISYSATNPPAITGGFFETVDIPGWL